MGGRVEVALKLVEIGTPVAESAKRAGITRSAVYQALAVRKGKVGRSCSECGHPLPDQAKASAKTCCGACRAARMRRLKAEAAKLKAERVALEIEQPRSVMRKPV